MCAVPVRKIIAVVGLLVVLAVPQTIEAAACSTNPNLQTCSGSYGVNEVYVGPGGNVNATSTTYKSRQSAEAEAGKTTGTSYQAQTGYTTSRFPVLEVMVNGGTFDMGVLNAGTTKATSASFTVRNYLSNGYSVFLVGNSLSLPNNGYTIPGMTSTAPPTTGTAQFGINLRMNTNPPGIGADPQQIPDATYSYGAAASGYNTANQFKFVSGDTIAGSSKSSGTTLYTMSAVANIANNTPAGAYQANLYVVVVPTF